MRDHGLTMRNAILFVMTSTFVIVVVFAFLILGMTMFAEGDAFSSAISSLLGATAGIVNIVNSSKKDDSKLNRLANKLIDTWASYSKNDTGISLNDDLRDTVIRRSKYIKQLEVADRAEVNDSTMFNQMEDQLKSYTSGIVSNKVEMVNQVVKDQAQHQIDEVKENVNDSVVVVLSMPTSDEVIISDPLSGQKSLTVPSDVELLDYNNLNTTIGELIDLGKGMLEEELGSLASYSASEKEDIVLDVLLRSLFLDVDGSLTVPVNMMVIPGITMESVCLADLDTFTLFDEINPIAAQTLQSKLHMDSWNNVTKVVKDYSNFVKTPLRTRYIFIHASGRSN